MQPTSELYKKIFANRNHKVEVRILLDGYYYKMFDIYDLETTGSIFADGEPAIGCVISGEIDFTVTLKGAPIARNAKISPEVRLTLGTQTSEWLKKGVYFIDTREKVDNPTGRKMLHIHGFDAIMRSEMLLPSTKIEWPALDTDVVKLIAQAIGVEVDPRTLKIMDQKYMIPLFAGHTCREVLRYIAASYCGCFIMSDLGELRLVQFTAIPRETNYLVDEIGNAITFGGDHILV